MYFVVYEIKLKLKNREYIINYHFDPVLMECH